MPGRAKVTRKDAAPDYRAAAEAALDQLDWAIDYLYRIGKPQIAAALRRNSRQIVRRLE
jgi:hypothetical protein